MASEINFYSKLVKLLG